MHSDHGDQSDRGRYRLCGGRWTWRGRPVTRQQRSEVVAIAHAGQTREDVPQVGERVFAVALTRDDDRVEDGGALSGVGMADEQPVFLADAGPAEEPLEPCLRFQGFFVTPPYQMSPIASAPNVSLTVRTAPASSSFFTTVAVEEII